MCCLLPACEDLPRVMHTLQYHAQQAGNKGARRWFVVQDLGAPDALGSALVQALLERHGALPAEVEGGLLAAAHACYEAGACADALEVLVQLAARAMQQWAQSRQWRPLAQLLAGAPLLHEDALEEWSRVPPWTRDRHAPHGQGRSSCQGAARSQGWALPQGMRRVCWLSVA